MKYSKFLSYVEESIKINRNIKFSRNGFHRINDDTKYRFRYLTKFIA